jgi:hypothetical protein
MSFHNNISESANRYDQVEGVQIPDNGNLYFSFERAPLRQAYNIWIVGV